MCGHDVPQQDVVLDAELAQDAVHDRRARFGGSGSGDLPLGCERDTAHARAAKPRSLADEDDACVRTRR